MSRRRYISTAISTDEAIACLVERCGAFGALLYTWMIPHAEDDGTLRATPRELQLRVVPAFEVGLETISTALASMRDCGLIEWDEHVITFPATPWNRIQTYVPAHKRRSEVQRKTPKNAEKRRRTPRNTASLSPSPSLSNASPEGDGKPSPGSFTKRLATRLVDDGVVFAESDTLHGSFHQLLARGLERLPAAEHHATTMGVIRDYLAKAQQLTFTQQAAAHTGRLVSNHGGLRVLDAYGEALRWGAGIGEPYASDPLALSKYVAGVLSSRNGNGVKR